MRFFKEVLQLLMNASVILLHLGRPSALHYKVRQYADVLQMCFTLAALYCDIVSLPYLACKCTLMYIHMYMYILVFALSLWC